MPQAVNYLVIKTRRVYGYVFHYGPMVSTPTTAQADAQRLYGAADYTVRVKPWVDATAYERRTANAVRLRRDVPPALPPRLPRPRT